MDRGTPSPRPSPTLGIGLVLILASLATARSLEAQGGPGSVVAQHAINGNGGALDGELDFSDFFGRDLAPLGDLNGDGTVDLAVGAPGDDDGGPPGDEGHDAGAVWILFLATDGSVASHAKISATAGGFGGGLSRGSSFGLALATLGDLDGDGTVELAVGSRDTLSQEGGVWIVSLHRDGSVAGETFIANSTIQEPGDTGFGLVLGSLPDLDGDGVAELVASGTRFPAPLTSIGFLWILFLDADGGIRRIVRIDESQVPYQANDVFGQSLASLADLDGDGRAELVVGAPRDGLDGIDDGAVWILQLDGDAGVRQSRRIPKPELADPPVPDDSIRGQFGWSVASFDDLDGDGIPDLAVGANRDGENRGVIAGYDGAVWILLLRADGSVRQSVKLAAGLNGFTGPLGAQAAFGSACASPGDIDGDGVPDLAVGTFGGFESVWALRLDAAVWTDLGGGFPGTNGEPHLSGKGTLVAHATTTLRVRNALPGAQGLLTLSLGSLNPLVGFTVGADGSAVLTGRWPAGIGSDASIPFQALVADPGSTTGIATTNLLVAQTP